MKITISDQAQQWFEDELGIPEGYGIRFLGKVYGKTEIHEGFSVAMNVEEPGGDLLASTTKDGILYFINHSDEWFFSGHDLEVDFDQEREEPIYHFHEQ